MPDIDCKTFYASLASGKIVTLPPRLADVEIGGVRMRLAPVGMSAACEFKPR